MSDRCETHGGLKTRGECPTVIALSEVWVERAAQFAKYGTNEDIPDGTGPAAQWLMPVSPRPAENVESLFRLEYEWADDHDELTWMHLVREELAEAFMETDPKRLREELVQVAALCVSWIEKIDTRSHSDHA